MSGSRAVRACGLVPAEWDPGEQLLYTWLKMIQEEVPRETGDKRSTDIRIEPEKLAVETASSQPSSGGIVIRANGVEVELPSGTDIEILAAFAKAISHA